MTDFDQMFLGQALPTLLDTFGETVEYRPVGDSSRSISVAISGDKTSLDSSEYDEQMEGIVVTAKRSVTAGITKLSIRDEIHRDTTHDPEQRPYVFSGEVRFRSSTHWSALFWRHKLLTETTRQ